MRPCTVNGPSQPLVGWQHSRGSRPHACARMHAAHMHLFIIICSAPCPLQVVGCGKLLVTEKRFYQRARCCTEHAFAPEVSLGAGAAAKRFCQQCCCFHGLAAFDDDKRCFCCLRNRLCDFHGPFHDASHVPACVYVSWLRCYHAVQLAETHWNQQALYWLSCFDQF